MEWITRLNNAIDYIEENLTEEINYIRNTQNTRCGFLWFLKTTD